MWAVLAIGLFNSIMFPTIFTLGVAKLGRHTGEGSGVLCMAIVGGAIVPVIQGYFADTIGLLSSFFVPAICYAYIVFYGLEGSRGPQRSRYGDFGRAARAPICDGARRPENPGEATLQGTGNRLI